MNGKFCHPYRQRSQLYRLSLPREHFRRSLWEALFDSKLCDWRMSIVTTWRPKADWQHFFSEPAAPAIEREARPDRNIIVQIIIAIFKRPLEIAELGHVEAAVHGLEVDRLARPVENARDQVSALIIRKAVSSSDDTRLTQLCQRMATLSC
jgi:hypothetical protein